MPTRPPSPGVLRCGLLVAALFLALSCALASVVSGAPLQGGVGWKEAPGVVWWYGGEREPLVRGNADAYCVEDGVCTAYGQGMAYSIEGGGSRVALPMVSR